MTGEEPQFVIAQTGRSGSGYIARVLTLAGVPCGHEAWFNPHGHHAPGLVGDSSWCAAKWLDGYRGHVWHQTRHPLDVIASLANGQLFEFRQGPYFRLRAEMMGDIPDDGIEAAVECFLLFNRIAEKHASERWQVEQVDAERVCWIGAQVGIDVEPERAVWALEQTPTTFNRHGSTAVTADDIPVRLRDEVADMTERYGYQL